jgi:hypothetical protein
LFHVKIDLDIAETSDLSKSDHDGSISDEVMNHDTVIHVYPTRQNRERIKTYERIPRTTQHFTEYRELTVPLEVIEAMRKQEGLSLMEWEVRGLEVKESTWGVLKGWVRSIVKEERWGRSVRQPWAEWCPQDGESWRPWFGEGETWGQSEMGRIITWAQ